MELEFNFNEKSTPRETGGPSPILGLEELLEAYNSLQAAGKLRRRKRTKSSDAYKGELSKEPGIRFETHSYFFAEYRDPVPTHANQRDPRIEAFIHIFLTDTEEDQLIYASRISSWFKRGYSPIVLVLHDHLANTVCYRSSQCRLFRPSLDQRDTSDYS